MSKREKYRERKVAKVMEEFKQGKLRSGPTRKSGKKGPVVKNPKQAIAIALSEAERRRKR